MSVALFQCHNPACELGSRKDPGNFTGGILPEQVVMRTGEPLEEIATRENEGKRWGEGVCPNCGEPAKKHPEKVFEAAEGEDPHQKLHEKVAAMVADPDEKGVTQANAQQVVEDLIDPETAEERAEVRKAQAALAEATAKLEAAEQEKRLAKLMGSKAGASGAAEKAREGGEG